MFVIIQRCFQLDDDDGGGGGDVVCYVTHVRMALQRSVAACDCSTRAQYLNARWVDAAGASLHTQISSCYRFTARNNLSQRKHMFVFFACLLCQRISSTNHNVIFRVLIILSSTTLQSTILYRLCKQ